MAKNLFYPMKAGKNEGMQTESISIFHFKAAVDKNFFLYQFGMNKGFLS